MHKSVNVCLAWHNLNSTNYGLGALAIAHVAMLVSAARAVGFEHVIETMGTANSQEVQIKERVEWQGYRRYAYFILRPLRHPARIPATRPDIRRRWQPEGARCRCGPCESCRGG